MSTYFIEVFFKLHLLASILFRPTYMIKLEELIVGNITDCNFRETKSVLDCET